MLTHSSPEVAEAFQRRQNTTGHRELWVTSLGALWRDGYIVGREEDHADQSIFIVKAALQEIAREVGVDVNLDGDLDAATFRELVGRVCVVAALGRQFEEMQKAERELSDAYIRLRTIAGALDVPDYWRPNAPNRAWSWTEARLRTIVEERDRLKATLAAVRKEIREAGVGAE